MAQVLQFVDFHKFIFLPHIFSRPHFPNFEKSRHQELVVFAKVELEQMELEVQLLVELEVQSLVELMVHLFVDLKGLREVCSL